MSGLGYSNCCVMVTKRLSHRYGQGDGVHYMLCDGYIKNIPLSWSGLVSRVSESMD